MGGFQSTEDWAGNRVGIQFLLAARLTHIEKALVIKLVTDFAPAKKNDG